ncbi:MAG: hypothetical protein R3B38_00245 [Patescibacteria group bacterium]
MMVHITSKKQWEKLVRDFPAMRIIPMPEYFSRLIGGGVERTIYRDDTVLPSEIVRLEDFIVAFHEPIENLVGVVENEPGDHADGMFVNFADSFWTSVPLYERIELDHRGTIKLANGIVARDYSSEAMGGEFPDLNVGEWFLDNNECTTSPLVIYRLVDNQASLIIVKHFNFKRFREKWEDYLR